MNAKDFNKRQGKVVTPNKHKVLQAEPEGHFVGMHHMGDGKYRTLSRREKRKLRKQHK